MAGRCASGTTRASRDNDQEARFASPLAEDAVALLTRVEQASFGTPGCGIDWRQPETRPASDDPKATESIYRGDTCNCQARVRSDAAGHVTGLVFRSAGEPAPWTWAPLSATGGRPWEEIAVGV